MCEIRNLCRNVLCNRINPSISHRSLYLRRPGLSLIEVIVVMAILGILSALAMVGVMQSRESSRSLACKNNLRQIGLATVQFHDAKKMYPYSRDQRPGKAGLQGLLPYLEAGDVEVGQGIPAIELFRCPLDTINRPSEFVNYIPCAGLRSTTFRPETIGFRSRDLKSAAQVRDGLSNTIFFSERLTLAWEWPATNREAAMRSSVYVTEFVMNEDEFDLQCWKNFQADDVNFVSGGSILSSTYVQTGFGTKYPPNHPSCQFRGEGLLLGDLDRSDFESTTATSLHPGFIHASMGDGSVHTFADDIDLHAWKAAGTIAGSEIVTLP